MKIRRVLVVIKRSTVSRVSQEENQGTSRLRQLLEDEDLSIKDLKASHEEHSASVKRVRELLKSRQIEVSERSGLPQRKLSGYDLIIAVGGDGMVLGVSHAVRDTTPVLGVNSAPSFSVGYLSGCVAEGLDQVLDQLQSESLKPLEVQRLQVQIGRRVLAEPILNDVLFCADNPAVMSRYQLGWPDGEEKQRSSGVWVSTPAGSTSALSSAGGPILPLQARQFAFLVREPYAPPGSAVRIRSAVLAENQELSIQCRTLQCSVFLDGSHRHHPIPFGETVRFRLHPQPLRLIRALS